MFETAIYIHWPCPTRSGLTVGSLIVEIKGVSSHELKFISVLTVCNEKILIDPRATRMKKKEREDKKKKHTHTQRRYENTFSLQLFVETNT